MNAHRERLAAAEAEYQDEPAKFARKLQRRLWGKLPHLPNPVTPPFDREQSIPPFQCLCNPPVARIFAA
jgi:hypothetical protein